MTENQLRAMTDEQIRARFQHAPAYYLQSKLDKKRALERRARREAACAQFRWDAPVDEAPAPNGDHAPASLDIALPGLEILDAALSASDYLDDVVAETPAEAPAEADAPIEAAFQARDGADAEPGLDAALDDYDNWPIVFDAPPVARHEPEPQNDFEADSELGSDSEPGLEFALGFEVDSDLSIDLLLDAGLEPDAVLSSDSELDLLLEPEPVEQSEAEPEIETQPEFERRLKLVLESEPDLELVLESDPELERELASEQAADAPSGDDAIPDNVTVGDFGSHGPRTVRVVSVVMDRKRPYMVRVVGETTRLAS